MSASYNDDVNWLLPRRQYMFKFNKINQPALTCSKSTMEILEQWQ